MVQKLKLKMFEETDIKLVKPIMQNSRIEWNWVSSIIIGFKLKTN